MAVHKDTLFRLRELKVHKRETDTEVLGRVLDANYPEKIPDECMEPEFIEPLLDTDSSEE